MALHERSHSIVRGWHLNSAQNIYMYQRIRRIIALSNQITLILKCVDSDYSKRSLKSIKLLYNRFLTNIISYLSVLFRIKMFLTTYISPCSNVNCFLYTRFSVLSLVYAHGPNKSVILMYWTPTPPPPIKIGKQAW